MFKITINTFNSIELTYNQYGKITELINIILFTPIIDGQLLASCMSELRTMAENIVQGSMLINKSLLEVNNGGVYLYYQPYICGGETFRVTSYGIYYFIEPLGFKTFEYI